MMRERGCRCAAPGRSRPVAGWVPRAEAVARFGAKRVEQAGSHAICDSCLEAELELLSASRRRAA